MLTKLSLFTFHQSSGQNRTDTLCTLPRSARNVALQPQLDRPQRLISLQVLAGVWRPGPVQWSETSSGSVNVATIVPCMGDRCTSSGAFSPGPCFGLPLEAGLTSADFSKSPQTLSSLPQPFSGVAQGIERPQQWKRAIAARRDMTLPSHAEVMLVIGPRPAKPSLVIV